MDRFEKVEMKKIRQLKNTWCNWLINSEPKRKSVSALKDKITVFRSQLPLKKMFASKLLMGNDKN